MYNFRLYNRSQSRNQRFAFNRLHLEGEREHWVSHKRRWRVSNLLQGKWESVPECWNFSKKRTQWSVLFYNFTTISFLQFSSPATTRQLIDCTGCTARRCQNGCIVPGPVAVRVDSDQHIVCIAHNYQSFMEYADYDKIRAIKSLDVYCKFN